MQDKENLHFEENKKLPQKRLYKNYEFQSNTGKIYNMLILIYIFFSYCYIYLRKSKTNSIFI